MRTKLGAMLAALVFGAAVAAADPGPGVGQEAKDFDLEALGGGRAKLSELTKGGPVVPVALRGYPSGEPVKATSAVPRWWRPWGAGGVAPGG